MKCKAFIYSFMLDSLFIKKNNVEYLFEYLLKNQVAQTQCLSHFESGLDGSRTHYFSSKSSTFMPCLKNFGEILGKFSLCSVTYIIRKVILFAH